MKMQVQVQVTARGKSLKRFKSLPLRRQNLSGWKKLLRFKNKIIFLSDFKCCRLLKKVKDNPIFLKKLVCFTIKSKLVIFCETFQAAKLLKINIVTKFWFF
jgi:hypothetical protein